MANEVPHFGELLWRKSLPADRLPRLLTESGRVAESEKESMRDDQVVRRADSVEPIA
jgi:hypothetical protein